jgi:hypothetical protein
MLVGWKSCLPHFAQAGVNSEGLCLDGTAVPPQHDVADNSNAYATVDIARDCAPSWKKMKCSTSFFWRDVIGTSPGKGFHKGNGTGNGLGH